MTIDFYNHDTRNGDLADSFEPNYGTQFSFKNTIDDFYIQHLEKSILTIDFFITRAQNAIKIGSAKVVLSKLLEKDHSFQAQEIVHDNGNGGVAIGKIFYKMRMRKSIDEAIKWYM
jgi:First C2 domain of RPGR-interacting protein 1